MNNSVTKAIQLLEELAKAKEPVALRDLAHVAHLNKATAYRLLHALCQKGIAQNIACPTLITHGDKDTLMSVDGARRLFAEIGAQDKTLRIYGEEDGGGALVGTSKNTYNLGAYYENDKLNARLSWTYRSDFYSGLDRSTAFYQASVGNLSGSLGYKFNDNISVTFDALNLNDPTLRYYALNKDQPRSIYQSGRQYYFNLRLNF